MCSLNAAKNFSSKISKFSVRKSHFGQLEENGTDIFRYYFENSKGMEIAILSYGGHIQSLRVPDKNNEIRNIVLGFDSLSDYTNYSKYFNCIIGRYANRIKNGKFNLNGKQYQLPINERQHCLHGGQNGFDKQVWQVSEISGEHSDGIELHYISKDMEEGFPGELDCKVQYLMKNDANDLIINYYCTTSQDTIVNLTNHCYFNLSHEFSKENSVYDNLLQINANHITQIDSSCIPDGELLGVKDTPFDFTQIKQIGLEIEGSHEQLRFGDGYDHNYVIDGYGGGKVIEAALAKSNSSGIQMRVLTNEPGIQFYSGNHLGGRFLKRSAFCLETQKFPDSPNNSHFPSCLLKKGQIYSSQTVYSFKVNK